MSMMQIMDRTGHTTINWDPNNPDDVRAARDTFDEMKKKGFTAFRVELQEGRGTRLDSFDPTAAKIMLVPQMAGG
jgi:hypothetical protein